LLVAAVCAALVLASLLWLWLRDSAVIAGPLHPAPNTTLNGIRLAAPGEITWGDVLIRNTTDRSVVLKGVRLGGGIHGTTEAMRVTRAEAVDPRRFRSGIGMTDGLGHDVIPAAQRSPLAGCVLKPGSEAEALLRIAVGKTGAWGYDHADVTYEFGGREFTVRIRQAVGRVLPWATRARSGIRPDCRHDSTATSWQPTPPVNNAGVRQSCTAPADGRQPERELALRGGTAHHAVLLADWAI